MNAIALAAILLIRLVIPVSMLVAIGEWVRHREANSLVRK